MYEYLMLKKQKTSSLEFYFSILINKFDFLFLKSAYYTSYVDIQLIKKLFDNIIISYG